MGPEPPSLLGGAAVPGELGDRPGLEKCFAGDHEEVEHARHPRPSLVAGVDRGIVKEVDEADRGGGDLTTRLHVA